MFSGLAKIYIKISGLWLGCANIMVGPKENTGKLFWESFWKYFGLTRDFATMRCKLLSIFTLLEYIPITICIVAKYLLNYQYIFSLNFVEILNRGHRERISTWLNQNITYLKKSKYRWTVNKVTSQAKALNKKESRGLWSL